MLKVFVFLISILFSTISVAQERDLPSEIKALAELCSSVASVKFKGEIKAGLTKFFSGVDASGNADYETSKGESDFLESFEDETLRLEARKVYNTCVTNNLSTIYNMSSKVKEKSVSAQEKDGVLININKCTKKNGKVACDLQLEAINKKQEFCISNNTTFYDELGGENKLTLASIDETSNKRLVLRKLIPTVSTPGRIEFDNVNINIQMIKEMEFINCRSKSGAYIFKNIPLS